MPNIKNTRNHIKLDTTEMKYLPKLNRFPPATVVAVFNNMVAVCVIVRQRCCPGHHTAPHS